MIAIVDYGVGNVSAFLNVYKRLNIPARTAATQTDLSGATKVILPGVGHFDHAMRRLDESGLRPALDELVTERNTPVLGVCVGMQMLAAGSDEGTRPGLGWIDGHVRAFAGWQPAHDLPTPHMGWNDVRPTTSHPLLAGLAGEARFYFLHSFFFECTRACDALAVAHYGDDFACIVGSANVYGVQFHPEKSHRFGAQLLKNFAEL